MKTDLTADELRVALANVGVDITCGACAELFYTGHRNAKHTHPTEDVDKLMVDKLMARLRAEGEQEFAQHALARQANALEIARLDAVLHKTRESLELRSKQLEEMTMRATSLAVQLASTDEYAVRLRVERDAALSQALVNKYVSFLESVQARPRDLDEPCKATGYNDIPCTCTPRSIGTVIAASSIGQGLANIREHGIDAELATLEAKPSTRKRASTTRKKATATRKKQPAGIGPKARKKP